MALAYATQTAAQGVPVVDVSNLARAISRVEELARDATRQGQKLDARKYQAEIYQDQRDA